MLLSSHHCLIPLPHSISPSIMSDQSSHVWALNICSDWGDQEELEGVRNCHWKDTEHLWMLGTRFFQPSEPTKAETASCGVDTSVPLVAVTFIKSCFTKYFALINLILCLSLFLPPSYSPCWGDPVAWPGLMFQLPLMRAQVTRDHRHLTPASRQHLDPRWLFVIII